MKDLESRWTKSPRPLILVALLGVSALVACGGGQPAATDAGGGTDGASPSDTGVTPPGPTCGSATRTGTTTCATSAAGTCPAGQYCDAERLVCSNGCTSEDNCGPRDHCVRAAGQAVGACQACPSCGDGICQSGEAASCATDCGAACGDGTCQATETQASCPADCGAACGDGTCQATETQASCPADCGMSALAACIATCELMETCGGPAGFIDSCRADCGVAAPSDIAAFTACRNDNCSTMASCMGLECIGSAQCSAGTCIDGTCCGNGVCDPDYETEVSCPADCARDFLAECYTECDNFAFFGCGVGCRDACTASTPSNRARFLECTQPALCNFDSCSPLL